MKTKHIVMTAAAQMPSSCWGRYARCAVVEIDPSKLAELGRSQPSMISARARGVVRIVETWERLHVGRTKRDAFSRALAEAEALAAKLNS